MSDLDELKKKAKQDFLDDKNEEAIVSLLEVIKIEPENLDFLNYLVTAYCDLREYKAALPYAQKSISLDSSNEAILTQLGLINYFLEKYNHSEKNFKAVLDLNSENTFALTFLGMIEKIRENYDQAIVYFKKSDQYKFDNENLIMLTETYLDTQDLDRAGEVLKRFNNDELNEEQFSEKNDLLVRYCLDKSMENWTGHFQSDGEDKYFPETLDQIEEAQHYLEMAFEIGTEDEYYVDRITLLEDVVKTALQNIKESSGNELLSEKEIDTYNKLEELFLSWSGQTVENGVELRWPGTKREIKKSEDGLKRIKKSGFSNELLIERYNELKQVVKSTKEYMPNYKAKFIRALFISVTAVILFFVVMHLGAQRVPDISFNKGDFVIKNKTNLVYDSFVDKNNKEKANSLILNAGAQVEPIARIGNWIQVKTESGDLGFVHYRKLNGVNNAEIDETTPFYSNYSKNTFTDSIRLGEKVGVLSFHKKGKEKYGHIVKIKTESGRIGYVPEYRLEYSFYDSVPRLSQTYTYPTTIENLETSKEKTLNYLVDKYGPITSVIKKDGIKIAYFSFINVISKGKDFEGVFFKLINNKVQNFELDHSRKLKWKDNLPLNNVIRGLEPWKLLSFSVFLSEGEKWEWWSNFEQYAWYTKVIAFVMQFLLGFIAIFLFFSIPRLVINPIMILISYAQSLSNSTVKIINWFTYISITYVFFVWMVLLMDQLFIPVIMVVITFIFWWRRYRYNINYNRCPDCHTMNVGISDGSTFRGTTTNTSWGTHDVYKGETHSGNVTTRHFERRDTKTTETIKHFTDHRCCVRCGYLWGIDREETSTSTKHY